MSIDQRAYIRRLERRVEHLERTVGYPTPRDGRLMTRPPRIVDVVLNESIASGESGEAVVRDYNKDAEAEVDTSETITVLNRSSSAVPSGAACVAIERTHQAPPRRWHLLGAPTVAPRIYKAKLSAALESADSTASVDNVVALDGGEAPEVTSASNWLGKAGADNSDVLITEDLSGEEVAYLLVEVKHIAVEVVIDVDTDDGDDPTELRKHTRTIVTMAGEDDTADETVITIEECEE